MVQQALWITLIGMGGVFAFLLLLIAGMMCLRIIIERIGQNSTLDKVAAAIAIAKSQE